MGKELSVQSRQPTTATDYRQQLGQYNSRGAISPKITDSLSPLAQVQVPGLFVRWFWWKCEKMPRRRRVIFAVRSK